MKTRIALAGVVLLLALTGCAGTVDQPTSEPQEAAASASSEPEQATSADASVEAAPELTELEQDWYDYETWDQYEIPKAERLSSARLACEEFAAGKTTDQMSLPGVPSDLTDFFATSSRNWFCPN